MEKPVRTRINALVTEKTLHRLSACHNEVLADVLCEEAGEGNHAIKNLCAKVSVRLSDEVDRICTNLMVSKRLFIESAVLDAVERAEAIMEREGLYRFYEAQSSEHTA